MAFVGIDLGTTNSLISYWTKEGVKLIPNEFGEFLTPSVVSFDENDVVCVGKTAKEMMISNPSRTFREFKRDMGTDKKYTVGNVAFSPEELSAFVLKKLKQDAQEFLQEEVTEAIISVPAYFSDKQRSATRIAGQIAGFKVERLINEPSAAALAYRIKETSDHNMYLVFDFGGGTLDISVVDAFDNIVEIIAVSGDNHLGGKDFNEIVEHYFYETNQLKKEDLSLNLQEYIYREAEICKELLSQTDEIERVIRLEDKAYSFQMTNEILKKESMPIFRKILDAIQKILSMSEIEIDDIDQVILVGGSSKMPVVQMFLKSVFKRQTLCQLNPDEIVALGTGILTGIKERKADIKDMLLSDICPFSLGVELFDGTFSSIIERNEILPCTKSGYYNTVSDNQTSVNLGVYQGNHMIAKDNEYLSEISIVVPALKAGEVLLKVDFSYDINGIFEIHVKCLNDGNISHKTFINQKSGMSEEEIQAKMQALTKMKEQSQSDSKKDYLIYRANRLYMMANPEQQQLILREMKLYKDIHNDSENKVSKRERYVRFLMILDMIESKCNTLNADDFFEKD